jgi:hypothetical protein
MLTAGNRLLVAVVVLLAAHEVARATEPVTGRLVRASNRRDSTCHLTTPKDIMMTTRYTGMGDGATHQYFDLPLIVAGKAQGQLKQGRFIQCKGGTLNSNMWLSIAQLMGLEIDAFADSSGVVSELWN